MAAIQVAPLVGYQIPDRRSRSAYPSSAQIFWRALSRAILRPSSALKFSGLAQADSPVTVKPLRKTSTQNVSTPSAVVLRSFGIDPTYTSLFALYAPAIPS